MKPMIERKKRFSYLCEAEIEDEHHFLLSPLYSPKRIMLEIDCRKTCSRYDSYNNEQKFIFIMSNEDKDFLKTLS